MPYASVCRVPLGRIAAICVIVLTAISLGAGDADARRKKKRIGHGKPPPFSHIVLDAKSGKALEAFKADERRYPASLTKVMTLYLLFEQIEAGKLKLSTPLKVSPYAATRPPTKLGLKPGNTIRVDDAIKALVTKSANDIAVVVAEAIGGSEREFARMMTSKARSLGMSRTAYANASGLPNPTQVTTARDQAILGRAIQWHFPRQYKYFATNSFKFHGREIRTHNRLLGRVKGVDGIKTGYTQASGFNLVTSVRRDRRHIVAVVIGGRTGHSRDAFMRKLIREYIDDASRVRTAQPGPAAAGAIDAEGPPTPPVRPTAAAEASAKLAATPADARGESGDVAVTTLSADGDDDTLPAAAAAPVQTDVRPTQASPPRSPVSATLPAAHAAPAHPQAVRVAAVTTAGLPMFPAWFPYLLVVFVGCAGSVLSAL